MAPEVAIAVSALKKNYGKVEAVRGIDFEVARGEVFGLLGPSKSSKACARAAAARCVC
jgi:ABC-2 type transport system ATP-binding protein